MVLAVCRGVLGDPHEAEDAFQATFLVLARKARTLWVRETIGPWLHAVALRAAHKAKGRLALRRETERRRAWPTPVGDAPGGRIDPDAAAVLHEELGRLPEKYRAPLVLCYLEGLTHERAARQLGWPLGTVRGRVARGRDLLRVRLSRRGLAPAALMAAGLSAREVPAAPLVRAAVQAALPFAAIATPPAAAIALVAGWRQATAFKSVASLLTAGLLTAAAAGLARGSNGPPTPSPAPSEDVPPPAAKSANTPPALAVSTDELFRRIHRTIDEVADPDVRYRILLELASLQAEQGEPEAARATCAEARKVAETIVEFFDPQSTSSLARSKALGRVAEAQAECGDAKGAVATAKAVCEDFPLSRKARAPGVGRRKEAGRYDEVVQGRLHIRDNTVRRLPTALAKGGYPREAAALADTLRDEGHVADGDYLGVAVLAHAKAGRFDDALKAARSLPSVDARIAVLAGRFFHGATTFQDEDGIAQLQARAGDLSGAKATVREALGLAGSAEHPSYARLSVARAQTALGDLPGAAETVAAIDEPAYHDWAYAGVVDALAAAGLWRAALAEAGEIKTAVAKASALIRVGLAYGRACDLAGARDAFGRAYEAVQELDTDRRHQALRHLARCQAEAGDVEGAFRTHDRAMETLESSSPRPPGPRRVDPFLLDQIAYQQAKSGDVAGARRTLETLTENTNWDYDTSKTLGAVARFQAATGPDGDAAALRWAEELDAPRQKAHALLGVARARGPKEGDGGRHAPAP